MRWKTNSNRSLRAFTIAEVAVAMAALVFIMVASISTITFTRVAAQKAKEQAIALDFLVHYLETLRGLPFDLVQPGAAINPLLNGANGAPNIRIPATSSPVSVDGTDWRTFHPELTWFNGRTPQLIVEYTESPSGAGARTKHLEVTLRWDPPLGRGQQQSAWLDLVRVRDL